MTRGLPFVLLAFAMGCNTPVRVADRKSDGSPIALTSTHLFTDEDGKPGAEVARFDYRQRTLHFRASLSRPVERSKGRWIFTAKKTTAGSNKAIQSLNGEVDGADMAATLSMPNPWPTGTYHVDILINERKAGEFDFEVTGEKSEIAFLGHSLAHDDGKGLPKGRVEQFSYPAKILHVQVTTKGVDTTEPDVTWRLFSLKDAGEVEVANTLQPKTKFSDSVLKAIFTSPKPFDRGDYRADLYISGKKAHSIRFQIK